MHYLLFIPGATPQTLESIAKVAGLSDLIDGGQDVQRTENSPANQPGLMLGWLSPTNPHIHFDASRQQWVPSIAKDDAGHPRYWVGFWKDNPPTQSELRRHYTQQGELIKFGADRWILPTPDSVDSRAVYSDDGSMRWEVTRQFSWMCDEAKLLKETYLEEFGIRRMVFNADPTAQVNWLLKLLRVNYRLLPEVAVHLDMWIGKDHLLKVFLSTLGLTVKEGSQDD